MNNLTSRNTITLLLLKQYRLDKGVRQAEIADSMGMSRAAWGKIESGKSAFYTDVFFSACEILGIQAHRLLVRVDEHANFLESCGWEVSFRSVDDDELMDKASLSSPSIKILKLDNLEVPPFLVGAEKKYKLAEVITQALCIHEAIKRIHN